MKKAEIPERFDLVSIKYKSGCKGLGYAPYMAIHKGDSVITEFGEGYAESIIQFCTPEDDYYKMISGIYTVDRITHKVVEIEYKKKGEVNSDLSEG